MGTDNPRKFVSPLVIVPDLGELTDEYRVGLSDAEWRQVEIFRDEKRQRHFMLGRRAARFAIRHVLGSKSRQFNVEVVSEENGAPQVLVNGQPQVVSISLSHSGEVAVACAWRTKRYAGFSIGVDVERLRSSEVASSPYAFSRRERAMLSRLSQEESYAGIAAWSAKEAVWKALRADPNCGPESIEIRALDLNNGCADVEVKGGLVRRLGDARIRTRLFFMQGPEREYVSSYAVTIPPDASSADVYAITNISLEWVVPQERL